MGMTRISMRIGPATRYVITDRPHPDPETGRVIEIKFDELALHIGDAWGDEQDANVVEACNGLIEALATVREAAHERLHAPVPA